MYMLKHRRLCGDYSPYSPRWQLSPHKLRRKCSLFTARSLCPKWDESGISCAEISQPCIRKTKSTTPVRMYHHRLEEDNQMETVSAIVLSLALGAKAAAGKAVVGEIIKDAYAK